MSDIQISIKSTEVKGVAYQTGFAVQAGNQLKLDIKTDCKIRLNMSAPLTAVIDFSFKAEDAENQVKLEVETFTPIAVSSFVDNLDQVIQNEFLSIIMLGINEKIRNVTASLGMNLRTPNVILPYKNS